jgi:hypothetical protein
MTTIDLDRPESGIQEPPWSADRPAATGHMGENRAVTLKDRFRNLAQQASNEANFGYRKIRVEIVHRCRRRSVISSPCFMGGIWR